MNLYSIVLFVHVFATLALFMAVAIETLCLHRMRGAANAGQLREWASLTRTTAMPLPLSTVVILASGLYMGLIAWDLTVPWIGLSLAVVAAMFVVGPSVNSRRLDAIAAAAKTAPPGPIPMALARRIQDPVLLASVHTLAALGFGVVFLKTVKPDMVGAVAALAVAVVLGGALGPARLARWERGVGSAHRLRSNGQRAVVKLAARGGRLPAASRSPGRPGAGQGCGAVARHARQAATPRSLPSRALDPLSHGKVLGYRLTEVVAARGCEFGPSRVG